MLAKASIKIRVPVDIGFGREHDKEIGKVVHTVGDTDHFISRQTPVTATGSSYHLL